MGEQGGYFLSLLSASAVLRVQVYGHVWSRRYLACVHDLDQSGESQGDVLLFHSCEVECSKCHLRTWFADGLGGDYSCSFAFTRLWRSLFSINGDRVLFALSTSSSTYSLVAATPFFIVSRMRSMSRSMLTALPWSLLAVSTPSSP